MEFLQDPFGLHADSLNTWQMLLRAVVVFFAALAMIRIAGTRTLSRQSAFDQLTMLIVGAILGRGVVTGKNFFGMLAAVLLIVVIHRMLAFVTYRSKRMGAIFKGEPLLLMSEGKNHDANMSRANITAEDIQEAMHLRIGSDEKDKVTAAFLERSGHISFVTKEKK